MMATDTDDDCPPPHPWPEDEREDDGDGDCWMPLRGGDRRGTTTSSGAGSSSSASASASASGGGPRPSSSTTGRFATVAQVPPPAQGEGDGDGGYDDGPGLLGGLMLAATDPSGAGSLRRRRGGRRSGRGFGVAPGGSWRSGGGGRGSGGPRRHAHVDPDGDGDRDELLRRKIASPLLDGPNLLVSFLRNFAVELWSHPLVRLGLLLILLGLILRATSLTLQIMGYFFSPSVWLGISLPMLSLGYLFQIHTRAHRLIRSLSECTDDPLGYVLEGRVITLDQVRTFLLTISLIPTLLEVRSMWFLSVTVSESGFLRNLALTGAFAVYVASGYRRARALTSDVDGGAAAGNAMTECHRNAVVALHLSALFAAIFYVGDVGRIHRLAPPFLVSAGSFLLTSVFNNDSFVVPRAEEVVGSEEEGQGDWTGRCARNALRSTLGEALREVGENVAEDEMLQLAMLRWIVEYWSSSSSSSRSGGGADGSGGDAASWEDDGAGTAGAASTDAGAAEGSSSSGAADSSPPPPPPSSSSSSSIGWDEMSSMLRVTTDRMMHEVGGSPASEEEQHGRRGMDGGDSSPSSPDDDRPSSGSDAGGDDEGGGGGGGGGESSVLNLQGVLSHLSVDNRAKPAVDRYKRFVTDVPPSRRTAYLTSVFRRCPACAAVVCLFALGCPSAFGAALVLLPLAVLEVRRVEVWAAGLGPRRDRAGGDGPDDAATEAGANTDPRGGGRRPVRRLLLPLDDELADADPMSILLSDDVGSTDTSQLCRVWSNVQSSVTALETGLTVARCVETTALAAEFASHVGDLGRFGAECYSLGWTGGLLALLDEAWRCRRLLGADDSSTSATAVAGSSGGGEYAGAALRAVASGRDVARNVEVLRREHDIDVVGVLADVGRFLLGRGWAPWWDGGGGDDDDRSEERGAARVLGDDDATGADVVAVRGDEGRSHSPQDEGNREGEEASDAVEIPGRRTDGVGQDEGFQDVPGGLEDEVGTKEEQIDSGSSARGSKDDSRSVCEQQAATAAVPAMSNRDDAHVEQPNVDEVRRRQVRSVAISKGGEGEEEEGADERTNFSSKAETPDVDKSLGAPSVRDVAPSKEAVSSSQVASDADDEATLSDATQDNNEAGVKVKVDERGRHLSTLFARIAAAVQVGLIDEREKDRLMNMLEGEKVRALSPSSSETFSSSPLPSASDGDTREVDAITLVSTTLDSLFAEARNRDEPRSDSGKVGAVECAADVQRSESAPLSGSNDASHVVERKGCDDSASSVLSPASTSERGTEATKVGATICTTEDASSESSGAAIEKTSEGSECTSEGENEADAHAFATTEGAISPSSQQSTGADEEVSGALVMELKNPLEQKKETNPDEPSCGLQVSMPSIKVAVGHEKGDHPGLVNVRESKQQRSHEADDDDREWTHVSDDGCLAVAEDEEDNWDEIQYSTGSSPLGTQAVVVGIDDDQGRTSDRPNAPVELLAAVSQHVVSSERRRRDNPSSDVREGEGEEPDWGKWVGGGLAVVGAAFVGAVALATKGHENERVESTRELASGVRIEELPDDDVKDEGDDKMQVARDSSN